MHSQIESYADDLSQHFERYFCIQRANSAALRERVFSLRYQVYCHELGYALPHAGTREFDEYDQLADHVLLEHRVSGADVGCIRLVHPHFLRGYDRQGEAGL